MPDSTTKTLKWKVAQNLERRWWKRYLKDQSPEEYRAWKRAYWEQFYAGFSEIIQLGASDTVADIGCGPAGIFTLFKSQAVTAVDPLLDRYEEDLAVFSKNDYPNVSFVTSAIEDFQTHSSFKLVCCLNAINHVSNLSLGFKKLSALTQENGYCLLSIDAHNFALLKYLFRSIPGDALHPHQYNLKEYQDLFVQSGFTLLQTTLYKRHPIFNYYILLGQKNKA